MGSERLSHVFAASDPTYKKKSCSSKHHDEKTLSQESLSHTSKTQSGSVSNGPKSSSSSSVTKHKQKPNPQYRKLIKLYSRQLSHIETTLNAIESLSKSENQLILFNKKRVDKLNEDLKNLCNSPSEQDHEHFDRIKNDIDQLINDIKSYKMDNNPHSINTIDYLVGFPLDVSDDEDKTLIYF